MKSFVGAFILIAMVSIFAHFMQDTPTDEKKARQQAEANLDRLLEQWSDWEYARSFYVGDYLCNPIHHNGSTLDAK